MKSNIKSMVAAGLCAAAVASSAGTAPTRTHALKVPAKMEMLRPSEVKPQGWLRDWCEAARDGYVSRLGELNPYIDRAWGAGYELRGSNLDWVHPRNGSLPFDNAAYWFEGLTRLAWQLDDDGLKEMARRKFENLLSCMNPKAICFLHWMDRTNPEHMAEVTKEYNKGSSAGFIIGSCGRLARGVISYYEVTGDERALKALKYALDDPRIYFLGGPVAIPQEAIDAWRYCGDEAMAKALDNFYANVPSQKTWNPTRYGRPVPYGEIDMTLHKTIAPTPTWNWRLQHGVQCWESLLAWLKGTSWTGDGKWLSNSRAWVEFFDTRTHLPNGTAVADELFGWPSPDRGTETCTVLGDIFVHATLASLTGEGQFADYTERCFFNAAAACGSRDYMHHVYFQAPNRTKGEGDFYMGPKGSGALYKKTHWPMCCTAAMTRFHGAFVKCMWMKPASGGLAATLYAPNTLETELDGSAIRIETKTDYPFNEALEMSVATGKPAKFPLLLRIPEWCVNPSIAVNGKAVVANGPLPVDGYGFAVIDREWKTGDTVSLRFPMTPKAETMRDYNDGGKPYVSLSYGPLLFAYGIAEEDENTPKPGVRTDWRLDSSRVLDGAQVVREAMPAKWDWPLAAPLRLQVKSADGEALELVPYGCAKLRVAMFPDDCGLQ